MAQTKTALESSPELASHRGFHQLPEADFSTEQIHHQINLILESRHFRQARSLEKFLSYVIAKKLSGAENELKEYTIGLEVFQRGPDYDPRRDAVVRVQANVLRKRLAAYYQEEGASDPLVIELPKGHYIPHCYRRDAQPTPEPLVQEIIEVALAEPPQAPAPLLTRLRSNRWISRALITATCLAGLLGAFGVGQWQSRRSQAAATPISPISLDPAMTPLWGKFLEAGVDNLLAFGTPQFFVSDGTYIRNVQINTPQEAEANSEMISLRKTALLNLKPIEIYTGVGETHGVYLLTRFFAKAARELRVTRSRMLGWNEIKNSNVIFLSSMRFHTLAKELPYPSDFAINSGSAGSVVNLRPAAGEREVYGDDGEYAVITVWPGKLNQRRIIELSGSTTWATLAAAEYVTDPDYLRQFNRHMEECRLKTNSAEHSPYFQVVLRAQIKDNQPVSINFVTHHDLLIKDQDDQPSTAKQVAIRKP